MTKPNVTRSEAVDKKQIKILNRSMNVTVQKSNKIEKINKKNKNI